MNQSIAQAEHVHALNFTQMADLLINVGSKRTVLVRGHMGTGKSSLLGMVAALTKFKPFYFDCTTKDLGDVTVPDIIHTSTSKTGAGYVTYLTNEELGIHLDEPICLMIDEFGKANPSVQNALLRLMLERKIGSRTLHPDSLIFATTNLGAENVGDLLKPHHLNRIITTILRKPTHTEWIEWGVNNHINAIVLGYCKENPNLFQGFEDVTNPEDNPRIYHPRAQRTSFVTPRSLHAASDIMHLMDVLDTATLTSALIGTIGIVAGKELMAHAAVATELPTRAEIMASPTTAKVPKSPSAVVLLVYRALANMDKDFINPWMDYMVRLEKEPQGYFAGGVMVESYSKRNIVMTNKKFSQWAIDNNHMFAADKV